MTALTKNQNMVLDTLISADGPLSAYAILDRLREAGFRAPPQVYRALDKLVEIGWVHRLESLNAFVACRDPGCARHAQVAFAICDVCGRAREFSDPVVSDRLAALAEGDGFDLTKTTVELHGTCADCRDGPAA